jgi:23S rRNA pseudouridine1911/1915/1917 synthase
MTIPVLYEDNHIVVIEKPVNLPVQEDQTGDRDVLSQLKEDVKQRYNKPGNVYIGMIHRLDRPVGGVMVFARTSKAASRLSDAVRRHAFDKEYLAVVRGQPVHKAGRLENYLLKDTDKNQVYVKKEGTPGAKQAVLEYRVQEQQKDLALLEVNLMTGRPHQIRVQLSHAGMPIYGDQKYGSHVNQPGEQIALWSHRLTFVHPVKKEEMTFVSSPPAEFPWSQFYSLREETI